MAEMKFFNYSKIVKDADEARLAGQRNRLNVFKLEEAKELSDKRKKFDAILKQYEDTPARIEALEEAGLFGKAQELADSHVKIARGSIEAMRADALKVSAANWDEYRAEKIQQDGVPAWVLPVKFDPSWMEKELKGAAGDVTNTVFRWGDPNDPDRVLAQDTLRDAAGNIIRQGTPYTPSGGRAGQVGDLPPSIINKMNHPIEAAFGGGIDPITGRLTILEKDTRMKVVQAQERAQYLMKSGEARTPGQAVAMALREMGMEIPDLTTDPVGIRQPRGGGGGGRGGRGGRGGPTDQDLYDASGRRLPAR